MLYVVTVDFDFPHNCYVGGVYDTLENAEKAIYHWCDVDYEVVCTAKGEDFAHYDVHYIEDDINSKPIVIMIDPFNLNEEMGDF